MLVSCGLLWGTLHRALRMDQHSGGLEIVLCIHTGSIPEQNPFIKVRYLMDGESADPERLMLTSPPPGGFVPCL